MIHLLLALTAAMAATTAPQMPANLPAVPDGAGLLGRGGPDAYGYRWLDNDTTAPGTPVYRWEPRVRTQGTRVTGLADDNCVGPFSIGFNFPYYWYGVNNFYVGSNGHVGLGPEGNGTYAAEFPNLPHSGLPNNTLAAHMFDLIHNDAPTPAKVFYWTNAALDTCIIEYDSVRYWGQSGNSGANSFQIILSKRDSSIAYMYQHVDVPPLGWQDSSENSTIGIENTTGLIGLSYMHGGLPLNQIPHDGLAIRFTPPATTPYQVYDMSVQNVMSANNGGFFVVNGVGTRFWAKVRNSGNQTAASVPVYCFLRDSSGVLRFADTVTLTNVPAGRIDSIMFPKTWTPAANGVNTMRVVTNFSSDMLRSNDTVPVECRVITYPAELGYERGTPLGFINWLGAQGGMGNHFIPPQYPLQVMGIKAYMQASPAVGCTMWLFAETNGVPGAVLGRGTVQVSTSGWYQLDFNPPVTVNSGGFFVGINSDANAAPAYGYDTLPPLSRQGWEYTGGWAPDRDRSERDMLIRALVRAPLSTDVGADFIRNPSLMVTPSGSVAPVARVKNFGTAAQSAIPVTCWVDSAGTRIYNNTVTLPGPLAAYDTARVTFPNWPVGPVGNSYKLTVFTAKSGDQYVGNDTSKLTTVTFVVVDTLVANWTTTPPTMDGNIQTAEWSDAIRYDISDVLGEGGAPQAPGSAYLYVKHDASQVYYAIDLPKTTTRATNMQFGPYLDEDNNGAWSSDSSEGNHWFFAVGAIDTTRYRTIVPGPLFPWQTTNPGIGHVKSSLTSGHMQFEAIVDKGTAKWNYNIDANEDIVGFYLYAQDTSTGQQRGHWPTTIGAAGFSDPTQYGKLVFKRRSAGDVSVENIVAPAGAHDTTYVVIPRAVVKNYGTDPATFNTWFFIDSGATRKYSQNLTLTVAAGASLDTVFPEWAKPHAIGTYATKCSLYSASDTNALNDIRTGSFIIYSANADTGWVVLPSVPAGIKSKAPGDGCCMAYSPQGDTDFVYLLKGNNRYEFYQFNADANTWATKESVPAIGRAGKKKAVKKGAVMARCAASGDVYATKGNNSLEFWAYTPYASGTYNWAQKADVPSGAKAVKEGSGMVSVQRGDTNWVYFFRGTSTQDFYRYNTSTDAWETRAQPPLGVSGKPFKKGSVMCVSEDETTIYLTKGNYNEFYAYDINTDVWTTKAPMPFIGRLGKKKKLGDGAGLAYHARTIYSMKGNNTPEMWSYACDSDRWTQMADFPSGVKNPKGGAAIVYVASKLSLYLTRGNKQFDFYRYGLPFDIAGSPTPGENATGATGKLPTSYALSLAPNPFKTHLTVSYALPQAGNVGIKLYDVTGKLVRTLAEGPRSAGRFAFSVPRSSLASGIYLLKFDSERYTSTRKVVLE